MQLVYKRHYLLRDKSGKRQVIQHRPILRRQLVVQEFSETELRRIVAEIRPFVVQKINASEVMRNFWQQASVSIQDDLVISFYYHEYLGLKKVLNVETENWLKIDFFNKLHSELRRRRWHVFHLRHALRALRATFGKHKCNLRFENIHLAIDSIGKTKLNQVHWDVAHPSTLPKMLHHFIFDDILG